MAVIEINDKNVEEMINAGSKVVIDCYATWCGPCKMLSPVIDELSEEREDVNFYKIDIDQNEETVRKYGIMSIPTILIFENGGLKETAIGFMTKDELEEKI